MRGDKETPAEVGASDGAREMELVKQLKIILGPYDANVNILQMIRRLVKAYAEEVPISEREGWVLANHMLAKCIVAIKAIYE